MTERIKGLLEEHENFIARCVEHLEWCGLIVVGARDGSRQARILTWPEVEVRLFRGPPPEAMEEKPQRLKVRDVLRFDVLEASRFRCTYCGRDASQVELHIDHIIPLAEGGETTLENLCAACPRCNRGKGMRVLDEPAP